MTPGAPPATASVDPADPAGPLDPLALSDLTKDNAAQRRILHRLKRAAGQLTAAIATVEAGGECEPVITQLAAVSSAVQRAGYLIVACEMKRCLSGDADGETTAPGGPRSYEELEKLLLMLN